MPMEMILLKMPAYQKSYKSNIGTEGGDKIHAHGVPETGGCGILPNPARPHKEIYENWRHAGCQYQKIFRALRCCEIV